MREITKLWMVILLGLLVLTACFPETPRATERPDNPTVQPEKKALQFIEFYSPMWSTCREVLPIVHGLEKEYGDRITFVRVNILNPESRALMEQYSFGATPEFYLVDEQDRIIGAWDDALTEDDLRQAFDEALNGL